MSDNKKEYAAQMLEAIRRIKHISRQEFVDYAKYPELESKVCEVDGMLLEIQNTLEVRNPNER